MFKKLDKCVCCDSQELFKFVDLGMQPLVNSFPKDNADVHYFPIEVNHCPECTHSQLSISVDQNILFGNYLYISGASKSFVDYFHSMASRIIGDKARGAVLDIGCNDGTFLSFFGEGWDKVGVDPAGNLADLARSRGVEVHSKIFPDVELGRKFDVITAFNVFAHVPNPYDFLCKCRDILNDDGKVYIQTSQKDILTNREFDTIYHEHISYFTIESMSRLCLRSGFIVDSAEVTSMHGKSYLFTLKKNTRKLIYDFQKDIATKKEDILASLSGLKHIVGYGAAAKGVVALNYIGVFPEYVIDDSELKQNRFIPGILSPIYSSEYLKKDERDLAIIILAWNLFDEIKEKITLIRKDKNDVFICLMPEFRLEGSNEFA